jgi:hypothetical protein
METAAETSALVIKWAGTPLAFDLSMREVKEQRKMTGAFVSLGWMWFHKQLCQLALAKLLNLRKTKVLLAQN